MVQRNQCGNCAGDQISLSKGCIAARNILTQYLAGVQSIEEVILAKYDAGAIIVPPNAWHPQSAGHFVPFWFYLSTPESDPDDARNLKVDPRGYQN